MFTRIWQVASQRTWPQVKDIDDCWVLAWQMAQIMVAPWLPWLTTTEARLAAGDPDDGAADGNDRGIWDMVKGVKKATPALGALITAVDHWDWAKVLVEVKAGKPFAAAVIGKSLPKVYTTVPHQVVIFHEPNVGLWLADPMAPDRSAPYRIATDDAAKACASFSGAGKASGVLFPTVDAAFKTHPLYKPSIDTAVAAASQPLKDELSGVAKQRDAALARVAGIKVKTATYAADIAND